MRQATFLSVVLSVVVSVGLLTASASAQQKGDRVVVTTENARLRSQNETTGTVLRGATLVVADVNGDWFWVTWSSGETETVKGWINRSDVIPFAQALDFFTEELKRNPNVWAYVIRATIWRAKGKDDIAIGDCNEAIRLDPSHKWAYNVRGNAWLDKKEYEKAIADFNEAIRLDPKYAIAHNNRGNLWRAKGEYDKAISDYDESIRLNPKFATAYDNRGDAWRHKNEIDKAISDFDAAVRLHPQFAAALNHLAWLAATCSDARYRNGKKAVDDATKVCELTSWKNWISLNTLAAAYAEAGDFDSAVKWQTKARDMAAQSKKADYQSRLDLYKAHKPYRDEPKK
jgi:tetratricopeptide (TPR) repeat protein